MIAIRSAITGWDWGIGICWSTYRIRQAVLLRPSAGANAEHDTERLYLTTDWRNHNMTNEQAKALEYPFPANEIEWRVLCTTKDKAKGQVAAFVDSRAIQKRLDAVLGRDNWQNHLCTVAGKDNSGTAHICEISIYYADRGEWITKSDGAGSTDIEPIKGGLSNAFKRAASMWGIGRYLYDLKNIWIPLKDGKYIPDDQFPALEKQYNRFVAPLLSAAANPPAGNEQTASGTESCDNTPDRLSKRNPL